MKKALAILAVVAVFSAGALGQLYYPTRDSGINKAAGEEYANMGAMTQCRAMMGRQHFLLMDFDWAAIEADCAGYAAPVLTFSMVAATGDLNGHSARIVISSNDVDWVEGDGTSQFTNFSWTDPQNSPAVTSQFAQTYQDPVDPNTHNAATSIGPWPWGDFDGLRNFADPVTFKIQYNLQPLVFGLAGVRTSVQLDQGLMDLIFSGTDATGNYPVRGIYLYDLNGALSTGEVYTSEAGAALSPYIFVPEPATLSLLALGGLALLRWRA